MGQPVSKNAGNAGYAPFENYQGPPISGGGLMTAQGPAAGGRMVQIDDEPFWNPDPVTIPARPMHRTARGNFGPPPGIPRRQPYGPPSDSVVNAPGYAQTLREQMMVEAEAAPWYRSAPPPSGPRQPNIKTIRTVINEPRGYAPPGQSQPQYQAQQQQSYQVQPQAYQQPQSYQVQAQPLSYQQPQSYQVQAQPQAQQPTQVMYYDPKTGALSHSGQQYSAPTGPVGCGTQACAPQQVVGYQTPVMGYQQPAPQVVAPPQAYGYPQAGQPIAYAYPQQQMTQPIVVPGQLYTADGGVQRLG